MSGVSSSQLYVNGSIQGRALRSILKVDEAWTYGLASLVLLWWFYDLHFHWKASPEYQFGWVVIALAGYLAFERWGARPQQDAPPHLSSIVAFVTGGVALLSVARLYEIGVARTFAASFITSIGCLCFVIALVLQGCGQLTVKHFLFPILFPLVAVPVPKIIWNPIVLGLQTVITTVNVELLAVMGIPAVQHGTTIALGNCVVGVDQACSGVRSLQSGIMAALFIGGVVLRQRMSRVFLVVGGIGLALMGNLVRSLFLTLAASRGGASALGDVHDSAGWSILIITAVGIAACAWILCRREAGLGPRPAMALSPLKSGPVQTNRGGLVTIASLFFAVLIGAWTLFHTGSRFTPERYALQFKTDIPDYAFKAEPVPPASVEILGTTNLLNGAFVGPKEEFITFAATWPSDTDLNVVHHTPDICWSAAGWKPVQAGLPAAISIELNGHTLPFECRVFASPDRKSQHVVVWCTLLGGSVLEEGSRWSADGGTFATARSRSDYAGRRLALSHFLITLRNRSPASGAKQFLRISTPVMGNDWGTCLRRVREFVPRMAALVPAE